MSTNLAWAGTVKGPVLPGIIGSGEIMSTLQISLPDSLRAVVDRQVASGQFASESEYVCRLIEEDQRRQAQAEVESFLISRVSGSSTVEMDGADWNQMRNEFKRRITGGGR